MSGPGGATQGTNLLEKEDGRGRSAKEWKGGCVEGVLAGKGVRLVKSGKDVSKR